MLIDTNIAVRLVDTNAGEQHQIAKAAIAALLSRSEALQIAGQNLTEFWSVATRPKRPDNGLGLSLTDSEKHLVFLERLFHLAPDSPDVYPEWRRLVLSLQVTGVQVFDARLAAFMRVNGISHILTFNVDHFKRYPGIVAVHPATIVAPAP